MEQAKPGVNFEEAKRKADITAYCVKGEILTSLQDDNSNPLGRLMPDTVGRKIIIGKLTLTDKSVDLLTHVPVKYVSFPAWGLKGWLALSKHAIDSVIAVLR